MSNGSEFQLPDSPHPASDLQAAVADAVPGATLRDATEFEEGSNTVYLVTVETDGERRELVLKVATHHPAAGCRAEPHLLEAVGDRTDVPVPEVVGTGHLEGDPYFLAERVEGEAIEAGRLRERFYDGYREESAAVLDRDGFEAHRRRCRSGARLRLAVNLDEEMAGRSEEIVDARAREHRAVLREFGVE